MPKSFSFAVTITELSRILREILGGFPENGAQSTSTDPLALRQALGSVVQGIGAEGLPRSPTGAAGRCSIPMHVDGLIAWVLT